MSWEVYPPAAQTPRSATILIVEDDLDIGDFLSQIIEEETPYSTALAENGRNAVQKAQELNPCLLLLDYRLPGMNGIEVYDRLQEFDSTRGTPAIMMSATLPDKDLQERGIYPLRKPMDIGGVIRMITHAMATFEEQKLHQNS